MNRKGSAPSLRAEAGFTLVELLVSLAVTAVLILGVLATFDFSARANRVQMNVADLQQSLRIAQNEIVRLSRMTGRGSLPMNVAVQVRNNVPANTRLISGDDSTLVQEGTDILTLRGVFSSSLYQIEYLNPGVWGAPSGGAGWVVARSIAAGVPQDLAALDQAVRDGEKTLLLVTPFDNVAVADITNVALSPDKTQIQVDFQRNAAKETALSAPLADGLPAVAYIGILEEYVFYVRRSGPGDLSPSLARARLEPGMNQPYKGEPANATMDLADNIADLQAAIGGGATPELRLTTLARTDRADPGKYLAPLLPALVEDHAYPPSHPFNTAAQRRYRWRLMRTNVNLRNI